ncbi:EamA family transporter [Nocardia sp. NPDC057353]|uniref:EamA family transporter n=1 Tax=Nocardia sp. NPDC057353 TaxID=3346104 RepID=UPI00363783F3
MTARDRLLGLTVVLLWGLNFLAIRVGLDHFPPFFFVALRFAVIAVPVLLFVPWPGVRPRWLLLYGGGFGIAQFAFLFTAMRIGMPTGLAALVLQSSAPFTVLLGALVARERLRPVQAAGIAAALLGMGLIGWDQLPNAGLLPVLLTLAAGLGWAFGNIGTRFATTDSPGVNPLHLTMWMTVIPPLPMLALSFAAEGPGAGIQSLATSFTGDGLLALAGLGYIVVLGTLVGSGLWTYLMSRYQASSVAPYSLLVPVVGMSAAWAVLGERPSGLAVLGALVVIAGAGAATIVRGPSAVATPAPATPRVMVAGTT